MSKGSITLNNVGVLVELNDNNELLWHRNAKEIIDDSTNWSDVNACLYYIIKTLFELQAMPKDSRRAFLQTNISMPDDITPDSAEWVSTFNWKLWQAAVSFGNNNLLSMSQFDLVSLRVIYGEMLNLLKHINDLVSNDSKIDVKTIDNIRKYITSAVELIPIVNKLGVECNHVLVPTMIDPTTNGYACMYCDKVFEALS